jgi:hypothetical protein
MNPLLEGRKIDGLEGNDVVKTDLSHKEHVEGLRREERTPSQKPHGGEHPFQEVLPTVEDEDGKDTTQSPPHGLLAPTLLPHRHVEGIGQLEDLVHEEGKEVQEEEGERKVLLTVAVVMLDVIPLVL